MDQINDTPPKVVAWGARNSCEVMFEDGLRAITSRNYIRKAKETKNLNDTGEMKNV
jgi:NAD(P)H-flavin reductase